MHLGIIILIKVDNAFKNSISPVQFTFYNEARQRKRKNVGSWGQYVFIVSEEILIKTTDIAVKTDHLET